DAFWDAVKEPGALSLKTKLDLWQMLRPAVQPGSKLDHTWPPEKVTLTLRSSGFFSANTGGMDPPAMAVRKGKEFELSVSSVPKETQPLPLEITLVMLTGKEKLEISYSTNEDPRARALPLRRFLLPWAKVKDVSPAPLVARAVPELKGGNWLRGKRVFFSE